MPPPVLLGTRRSRGPQWYKSQLRIATAYLGQGHVGRPSGARSMYDIYIYNIIAVRLLLGIYIWVILHGVDVCT